VSGICIVVIAVFSKPLPIVTSPLVLLSKDIVAKLVHSEKKAPGIDINLVGKVTVVKLELSQP
jgi:hypothetical protein